MNRFVCTHWLLSFTCLGTIVTGSLALTPSTVSAQKVLDLKFDDYSSPKTYTKDDWESDWNDPVWEDGIREERVSIVTGANTYRGRGGAMAVDFPAGSVGPKEGGAQWKFDFDEGGQMVRLRYRVKFADGFDFVRGGKLPGLAGGTAPTGSTRADGFNGFSARMMWRTEHDGDPGSPVQTKANLVQYVKHTTSGFNQDGRQEDNLYWTDGDGEPIEIESGRFYRVVTLLKLNKVGRANGRIKSFINGQRVLDASGIEFRKTNDLKIDVFYFTTFFGGSKDEWGASKDETIYFDEFEVEVLQ